MPNAELFPINPNRVHMIAKCKSNLQLALLCNLGNSFQIHPVRNVLHVLEGSDGGVVD